MESLSRIYKRLHGSIFTKSPSSTPPALYRWVTDRYPNFSLAVAGIVVLAELPTVARRTAFTGTSSLLDALILCPGLHRQQDAPRLNGGEYPACAAMTTGYVFRIENQATVFYLQNIGRPGYLTCLTISNSQNGSMARLRALSGLYEGTSIFAAVAYVSAATLTIAVLLVLALLEEWCGFAVVGILIATRLINVLIIRRRASIGWKGEPEPGKQSDLIVLLSQDRWIRIRGAVDDVKAVTSGEWLREPTFVESFLSGVATLMVYVNVAIAANSSIEGNILLAILLFCSAGLLGLTNHYTEVSNMYGRTLRRDGAPQRYQRRLLLTKTLIKETGRSDWAIRLGLAQPSDVEVLGNELNGEQSVSLRHDELSGQKNPTANQVDLKATM